MTYLSFVGKNEQNVGESSIIVSLFKGNIR